MAFRDRLKEARLKSGYTQEQVAEKIGIAKSTFTGYETGNSEPNMNTVSKLMQILHVDANFLYQDEMESNYPMKVSYDEFRLIEKYRTLDDHGREMVDFTLQKEWERSTSQKSLVNVKDFVKENPTHTIAAHFEGDSFTPEEAEEIKQFEEYVKSKDK